MAGNVGHRSSGGFRNDLFSVSSSSRPNFLSTFERKSHYPIFSAFCNCLSIAEIVSLTRTCKSLSSLYQYLLPVLWDVDKALRRYFDDPHGFRSQMAKCDALMFGYFANQFFERIVWKCQVLDVAVQQGAGSELFSNYLSYRAGYTDIKTSQNLQEDTLLVEIRDFKRDADSKTAIRLRITKTLHPEWNKAYSIFALSTSIQNTSYFLQSFDSLTLEAALHDSQNGWRVQGPMSLERTSHNHPIRERRRLGDRYTWTIPFDTKNVESSKTPDYVLEYASFKMDTSMSYDDDIPYETTSEFFRHYTIHVKKLESRVLKHVYSYGDTHMVDFFLPPLHASTIREFCKLDPAQRPTNYDEILRNRGDIEAALEGFDRPASWTYRDDEIPSWYEALERYLPE